MKYIIELDDNQLLEYGKDTDTYFRTLYKAKGFNTLVFDKNGLDKLTPLDKELKEAYLQGKYDAEQDLAKAAYDEAYQKGVHDGSLDVKQRVDGAYQKGFEVGSHEATTLEYQQGLNDAWECAKRIVLTKTDENSPYFTVDELIEIFGYCTSQNVLCTYSASEAIEKVKAYEEQQKVDDEIKVSDIITDGKINYLVIDITDESYVALQGTDFEPVYIGKDYIKSYHNLHDSKDMRMIAKEISKAMKGEQRDCHTCKHQVVSSIECVDCRGFEKWEPKEVTE